MKYLSLYFIIILPLFNMTSVKASNWTSLGSGLDLEGRILFADTIADRLFVGGNFRHSGNNPTNSFAAWTGVVWDTNYSGMTDQNPVHDIYRFESKLYAGGSFRKAGGKTVNGFTYWNGLEWDSINIAFHNNGVLSGFSEINSELICVGSFDSVGLDSSPNIASWDGFSWNSIGLPHAISGYSITDCVKFQNELFFSGHFCDSSFVLCDLIKWDGINWTKIGGFNGYVFSMSVYNNELYIGGDLFTGVPGQHIVKYDGTNFHSVGGDINGPVHKIKVINNQLFAAGIFTTAGSSNANCIARWDGISWFPLTNDTFNNGINDIELFNNELYITGSFLRIGIDTIYRIAKFIGSLNAPEMSQPLTTLIYYPNPVKSVLVLIFTSRPIDDVNLIITNSMGISMYWNQGFPYFFRKELDISELASGIYFITLESTSGRVTKKFIKD